MDTPTLTPSCRMAYAINNYQPVICTIISDQPLFYMDYEEEFEEEGTEFTLLAADQSGAEADIVETEDCTEEFAFDMFTALLPHGNQISHAGSYTKIEELTEALRKSRLAGAFLDIAEAHDTALVFSKQIKDSVYDRRANKIFVRPDMPAEDQLLLTARELRRVWQHREGALIDPLKFHPDHAVLVNRAQIADLAVMTVRIGWELQLAGHKSVWIRLEDSSMSDVARAMARDAHTDFRNLDNGNAMSSSFEAWFLSNRCQQEDRTLIQAMLSHQNTFSFQDEDTSRQVASDVVQALGSMPYGKNYLSPYLSTIMADSVFTDVRDRSNANFLWFIKFERTFSEAERNLQGREDINKGGDQSAQNINTNKSKFSNHEQTSEVIQLPQSGQNADHKSIHRKFGSKPSENGKKRKADIISFQEFRSAIRVSEQR